MAAVASAKTRLEKETAQTAGTGTIESSGTAVTGTGTQFDPETPVGSVIIANGEARVVTARASDTGLTVNAAFTTDLPALTTFTVVTFGLITGASDLSGPEQQAAEVDVSSFSTEGFREFITGLRDPGNLSFTIWFQPKSSVHAALQTDFDAGTRRVWRVFVPDAADGAAPPDLANSFFMVVGYVSQISFSAGTDSAWQAQASVRLTGKPYIIVGVD
jgi:hypothetical protein